MKQGMAMSLMLASLIFLAGCNTVVSQGLMRGDFVELRTTGQIEKIEGEIQSSQYHTALVKEYRSIYDKQIEVYTTKRKTVVNECEHPLTWPFLLPIRILGCVLTLGSADMCDQKCMIRRPKTNTYIESIPDTFDYSKEEKLKYVSRTSVQPSQQVSVRINDSPVQKVTPKADGVVAMDLYGTLSRLSPLSVHKMCYQYLDSTACHALSKKEVLELLTNDPAVQKRASSDLAAYDSSCKTSNDVTACQWAGIISETVKKDRLGARTAYLRSCLLSKSNQGCQEAAELGAGDQVGKVLAKREEIAAIERQKREQEEKVREEERAAERARDKAEQARQQQIDAIGREWDKCSDSCINKQITCSAGCIGRLNDYSCGSRCYEASTACTRRCDERRDSRMSNIQSD